MRIAIIGAGFAGVSAGKVLTEFGHDVAIFEKAPDVGGVWSSTRRYPGLSTQNNKGSYSLIDFPFPKDYPEWPSGEQVQRYIASYVATYHLGSLIRLSTEVVRADLDESGETPLWTIASRPTVDESGDSQPSNDRAADSAGEQREEQFDFLVVANGIFSQSFVPPFPGRAEFEAAGGRVCTPSDIRCLDEVEGKDAIVIGYGKSACDIATAMTGTAKSTTVVARHLLWKMPKKLLNRVNFKFIMLPRLGEALFEYSHPTPAEKFLHGRGKPVRNGLLKTIQGVAVKQLKLETMSLVPEGNFERIARSTVSLASDGFYDLVADGLIVVRRESEVTRLLADEGGTRAELSDGSVVPADLVVAATGWRQGVPFLSDELENRFTDDAGNFELYRFILPHDVPGLAFCGYNSSIYSPLSAQLGALWIANYLMGKAVIPSLAQRRREVQERLRWMEERSDGKHARGTNLVPFSMHNVDESLADMGLHISRVQRAKEWLLPTNPQNYRFVAKKLLSRSANR